MHARDERGAGGLGQCRTSGTRLRDAQRSRVAITQFGGPLVFAYLVTGEPVDAVFVERLVDAFLAAHKR